MRHILFLFVSLAFSFPVFSQEGGGISFGLSMNQSSVSPQKLNDYRAGQLWNTSTPSGGEFNKLSGFAVDLGYHMGDVIVGLEYSQVNQVLPNTNIFGSPSYIQDSFFKDTLYLTYDYKAYSNEWFGVDIGAGVGYAIKYEYHQELDTPSGYDDITWQSNPFGFKARFGVNIPILSAVNLRLGAQYESMTAYTMKAKEAYSTSLGNYTADQTLTGTQGPVKVDMSGLSYGVSLGILL